jgi:isochorismate pyruvate lyase
MKTPEECTNIQEIREEIDRIDQEVIALIGKRYEYVKAAVKFKTSETDVKAPDRFAAMLQKRRIWAEEAGLDQEVIEKLYTDLVNYFIHEEMKEWRTGE